MNVETIQLEDGIEAGVDHARPLLDELEASLEPDTIDAESERYSLLERFTWFRDLPIKRKISVIFGAFTALGLAIALILGFGLTEIWFRYQHSAKVLNAANVATELRGATGELRFRSARFVLERDPAVLTARSASLEETKARLEVLGSVARTGLPGLPEKVATAKVELETYDRAFERARQAIANGDNIEPTAELVVAVAEAGDQLFADSGAMAEQLQTEFEERQSNGIAYFLNLMAISAALALVALVILLLGLSYLSRDLPRKIGDVTTSMTKLASGDDNFKIVGRNRSDEIGEMLRALSRFKKANRQLNDWAQERTEYAERQVQEQKKRALEREELELRKVSLMSEVAESFERSVGEVVESVAKASGELQSTATRMAETADEASASTNLLSKNMDEASAGATSAAAACDEFALSIGEISQQASSSSELARRAADATQEADTTISALADSAEQVGEIVDLIQTIAQRTNLLALNASIEAARGGEAGRGFAVVASEVKELAMQTSRATDQVSHQIRSMQETTGDCVSALRSIAGQVKELESTAIAIASAVDQQSVAGQDLARSIDLAARGTETISGRIDDVRALSLSTGAAASQVLTSANDLGAQASQLSAQVEMLLKQVREA